MAGSYQPQRRTSEVVPHVPARSAPIDADTSTKRSEIFHVAGSTSRTARRHICARIGVPTTTPRPPATVRKCTTIRLSSEHLSTAHRALLMKRTRRLSGANAKRPMLAQTAHVLVETSGHANERQGIGATAITDAWRRLSLLTLIVHSTAGAGCSSPIAVGAVPSGHNLRQNARVVPVESAVNLWEFRGNHAASLVHARNCYCRAAELVPQLDWRESQRRTAAAVVRRRSGI
jgi:hypothetical protein